MQYIIIILVKAMTKLQLDNIIVDRINRKLILNQPLWGWV
jgi:hypothetical protein